MTWKLRSLMRRRPSPKQRDVGSIRRPAVEELEPRVLLSVADYVNPFIGTGGSGWFAGDVWPGADVPAGMLQWSPDTPSNIPGGYRYADNTIKGFGLDHFSGRGITYMEDIP